MPVLACFLTTVQANVSRLMPLARDLNQLPPGISVWHTYDPAVKAELFSSAIVTPENFWLDKPSACFLRTALLSCPARARGCGNC